MYDEVRYLTLSCQAVNWWERAAHAAQEEGIDPSEALRLFQRAEEIATILKAACKARSHTEPARRSMWHSHSPSTAAIRAPSRCSSIFPQSHLSSYH